MTRAADFKLLLTAVLLGFTLTTATACPLLFWPCSGCEGCNEPTPEHYGVFTAQGEPEDISEQSDLDLPAQVALLGGATIEASVSGSLIVRYQFDGRPVTLTFSQEDENYPGVGGDSGLHSPDDDGAGLGDADGSGPEVTPSDPGQLATLDAICGSGGTYPAAALAEQGSIVEELRFHAGAGFGQVGCGAEATAGMMMILEVTETVEHRIAVRSPVPVGLSLHGIEDDVCSPLSPPCASSLTIGVDENVAEVRWVLTPGGYQIIVSTAVPVAEGETFELTLERLLN